MEMTRTKEPPYSTAAEAYRAIHDMLSRSVEECLLDCEAGFAMEYAVQMLEVEKIIASLEKS